MEKKEQGGSLEAEILKVYVLITFFQSNIDIKAYEYFPEHTPIFAW